MSDESSAFGDLIRLLDDTSKCVLRACDHVLPGTLSTPC